MTKRTTVAVYRHTVEMAEVEIPYRKGMSDETLFQRAKDIARLSGAHWTTLSIEENLSMRSVHELRSLRKEGKL